MYWLGVRIATHRIGRRKSRRFFPLKRVPGCGRERPRPFLAGEPLSRPVAKGNEVPKSSSVKVTAAKEKRRVPKRLTDHFERSLESHDKLMKIVRISEQGMRLHVARPNLIKVLAEAQGIEDSEARATQLADAEADAALARLEIDHGYPVLHSFATIALWSWLEDFIKGLAAAWLVEQRAAIRAPAVSKLKVRLGDYIGLSRHEQALHIIELMEQDTGAGLRSGVNRFQSLLLPFGFDINLDDEKARDIYEFQMVRNNLAHRNGLVDQRMRQACPWLKLKLGQPLHVTHGMIFRFARVGQDILLDLLYQAGDRYDLELRNTGKEEP